jgi:hypothetical protein
MNLEAAVHRYLAVTGEFGRPMPLTAFGLDQDTTEAMLATWEEDYQLHRHLELLPADPTREGPFDTTAQTRYFVGGIAYTGIVFRPSIRAVIR